MSGSAAYEIYPVAGSGGIQKITPSIDPIRSVGIFNSSDRRVYMRFQTGDTIFADPSTTLAFPIVTGYVFDVYSDGQILNGSAFVDFSAETRAGIFGLANKYPRAILSPSLNNSSANAVLDRPIERLTIEVGEGATAGLLTVGVFVNAGSIVSGIPVFYLLEGIQHAAMTFPATFKHSPYTIPVALPSGWAINVTYTGSANITVLAV